MGLKKQGFTLVELVLVIIVLAIIGTATTSYIATGITIYTGISERDRELGSIRFAMERLRRDVLNALPNSLVVSADSSCLTFTPIKAATIYGYDFPIAPLTDFTGNIGEIDDSYTFTAGDKAVVYLLNEGELSASNVQEISAVDSANETISFSTAVSFPLDSPSKRLYIINENRSYYFAGDQLFLGEECNDINNASVMANNIDGAFNVSGVTLQRNGLAKVVFNLDFNGQEVPIEQTLHVTNVP